jgi:hypothetical protein
MFYLVEGMAHRKDSDKPKGTPAKEVDVSLPAESK